ncbi:unnamed protein product [Meloidogyne enterolobii]|uniref:Uncharacterized protein n=2 Tax=Meloidogyne enterolobii TaxID=390850 RepID=A0ACB0XMK8_MELEN|nr:unnamed protein product [Meloidogyne enterolobii]
MNSSEPEQIFAGGKDVKEEPASDVVDAEPCRQMEVKMEVAEELNENLATPQLQQKKRKRLPQRKRMQLKKIKAMEANKLREDKNCDATATSKVDVSAQPPKKKRKLHQRDKKKLKKIVEAMKEGRKIKIL